MRKNIKKKNLCIPVLEKQQKVAGWNPVPHEPNKKPPSQAKQPTNHNTAQGSAKSKANAAFAIQN